MWDVATPHGFFRTITHAVGTGYIPSECPLFSPFSRRPHTTEALEEFGGSQTPIGEIFTSWHSPRPSLYIGSSLPPMSRSDSQTDSLVMEFQQRQMGYISSFRENMPREPRDSRLEPHSSLRITALDDPAPNNPSDGNSCDNYSSFASTPPSSDGSSCAGSNIAPSPVSYRSTSLTADHLPTSPYISPLDVIVHGPPHVDGSSSGCPPQLPTVADRLEAMSPISQRIFMSCGSDPVVQSAVLDVLESPELMAKMAIRWEMAEPLLEKVMYGNVTDGKGKRGAPEFYKCRWGSCSEKMRRRLHALEHIMTHVNNRSHICSYWCARWSVSPRY